MSDDGLRLYVCPDCYLTKMDAAQMPVHDRDCGGKFRPVEYVPYAPVEALRAENTRLREALDGIVEDLSVPSRPAPWVSHALKLAQDALKVEPTP